MAFMDEFAHPMILRRKRRGIKPEEIKKIEFSVNLLKLPWSI